MGPDMVFRRELLALLRGGNSYMTFDEIVDRFPIKDINQKAPHVPYSVWHLLEHMRIAQWDILEFIRNPEHVSPSYPEGYRPGPEQEATEEDWKKTVHGFLADRSALEKLVEDGEKDILTPLPHAPEYTIFREMLVVADHNAYHLGEIAMLRQVMDLWPEDNPYLTGTLE